MKAFAIATCLFLSTPAGAATFCEFAAVAPAKSVRALRGETIALTGNCNVDGFAYQTITSYAGPGERFYGELGAVFASDVAQGAKPKLLYAVFPSAKPLNRVLTCSVHGYAVECR